MSNDEFSDGCSFQYLTLDLNPQENHLPSISPATTSWLQSVLCTPENGNMKLSSLPGVISPVQDLNFSDTVSPFLSTNRRNFPAPAIDWKLVNEHQNAFQAYANNSQSKFIPQYGSTPLNIDSHSSCSSYIPSSFMDAPSISINQNPLSQPTDNNNSTSFFSASSFPTQVTQNIFNQVFAFKDKMTSAISNYDSKYSTKSNEEKEVDIQVIKRKAQMSPDYEQYSRNTTINSSNVTSNRTSTINSNVNSYRTPTMNSNITSNTTSTNTSITTSTIYSTTASNITSNVTSNITCNITSNTASNVASNIPSNITSNLTSTIEFQTQLSSSPYKNRSSSSISTSTSSHISRPSKKKVLTTLLSCRCSGGCRNTRCACVRKGRICGIDCRCVTCRNPFLIFSEFSLYPENEEDAASLFLKDICLIQNLSKVKDMRLKLSSLIVVECCGKSIPVRDAVFNYRCEECCVDYQYSWCMNRLCNNKKPRTHCEQCKRCGDHRNKHCKICGKCYFAGVANSYSCHCQATNGSSTSLTKISHSQPISRSQPKKVNEENSKEQKEPKDKSALGYQGQDCSVQ